MLAGDLRCSQNSRMDRIANDPPSDAVRSRSRADLGARPLGADVHERFAGHPLHLRDLRVCSVVLGHPHEHRWTSLELPEPFLATMKRVSKRLAMLEGLATLGDAR